MIEIQFVVGELSETMQQAVNSGFDNHSKAHASPPFKKERVCWQALEDTGHLVGVLTADILWDWVYIDELWVDQAFRSKGIGKMLMEKAEAYAIEQCTVGLWLWTQSWQAPEFYKKLGYREFTRFEDFPKGHARIGFRKQLPTTAE